MCGKVQSSSVDALASMFSAYLEDFSRLASGIPDTSQPPGPGWRLDYSPKARDRAYDGAYTAKIKELEAIRQLQVVLGRGKSFITPFDSAAK